MTSKDHKYTGSAVYILTAACILSTQHLNTQHLNSAVNTTAFVTGNIAIQLNDCEN